jgi:hypothetical protein
MFLCNNLVAAAALLIGWRQAGFPGRRLARWSAAQLAVLGLFAPWLALHLGRATTWAAAEPPDFSFFAQLTATLFSVGVIHNIEAWRLPVALLCGLAALGALSLLRWRTRPRPSAAALFGLLAVSVPALTIFGLAFTPAACFAPQVQPRYLVMFLPGFLLLLALGVRRLYTRAPRLGLTAMVLVLAAQVAGLAEYYGQRRLRDEYFTLANLISAFAQPGDGVLLHTDHDWPVFLYHLRRPVPWDGVLSGEPLTPGMAEAMAIRLTAQFDRVWLVVTPDALDRDPEHAMQTALAQRLPLQQSLDFDDKRLLLFAPQPDALVAVPADGFAPEVPRQENLGPGLTLLGYDWPLREIHSGAPLHLVTYWTAAAPAGVTATLRRPDGQAAANATLAVPAGERVRVQTDLTLPPGSAGTFTLDLDAGGQRAALSAITAWSAAPPPPPRIPNPLHVSFGESIRLAGFGLDGAQAAPGDTLALDLFWTNTAPLAAEYKVFVHLVGAEFNPDTNNPLWGQVDRLPFDGSLPMTTWVPGQVLTDRYLLPIDPDAPPGAYALTVGLYDGVTGARLPAYDAAGQPLGDELTLATITVP